MKTKCSISISRPSGRECGYISIRLRDEVSRVEFFEGEMELADFAEALTGLSSCPIEGTFRLLECVGMERITEEREILCPLKWIGTTRDELSAWLEANVQEEGWIISTYLGSKSSIRSADNGTILRYSATKFIPANAESIKEGI